MNEERARSERRKCSKRAAKLRKAAWLVLAAGVASIALTTLPLALRSIFLGLGGLFGGAAIFLGILAFIDRKAAEQWQSLG
jgi:hypothetical protein